jgi:transposase
MKFVATKAADQLDLQALHRVRERLVSQRTGIINQIRAFLLERGVAVRQGHRFLRTELPRILAAPSDVLSLRMVRLIADLAGDWRRLDERVESLSGEIAAVARQDAGCERHLRRHGWCVGRHRVRRLMLKMGLAPIYQRPKTSEPHPQHRIWPYLLRHLTIDRPNQVWCADVTYIPMRRGLPPR